MKINEETRKPIENARREKLRIEKPLVYEKIIKYDEKDARGESTAIIDFCFSYKCNMNCEHCCNLSFEKKKREMTIEDLKDVARQADELGLAQFNISGGEPLTFENLDEIIEAINPEKFHISMSSNGLLLTKEKAEHLKKIGLDKIRISIDSFNEEEYLKTRKQEGTYNKAIEALLTAKEAGLQTAIQTVVSHQSCKAQATEDLAKFANDNGFNLDLLVARAIGRWEGKEEVLIDREDAEHLVSLRNKYPVVHRDVFPTYNQNRGCGAVSNNLHLTKYGDILPCVFIHISIGNIFEEPLKDIIERGLSLKWFGKHHQLCLSGENRYFISKYMSKFYGKPLPISYKDAFTEEDYIK
jgi:MoaA/NifB/PqqE/SkfB family radical SAM enzyme